MYAEFFGFRELPFNNTPDPRFFYSTPDHEEALASLAYTVQQRKGFVLLTGEVGTGKTLISRLMLRRFGANIAFAHINHAVPCAADLLEAICTELEITVEPGSTVARVVRRLHDFLLARFAQDVPVVLVLDEAQNLPDEAFELIRTIGNLEADDAKLLQIVMVGQPELQERFASPRLRQLRQRVFRSFHLPALSRAATDAYIRFRIEVAGGGSREIFQPEAVSRIFDYSQGLPRLINTLCDNALLSAYSADRRTIDGPFLQSVVDQLMLSVPAPRTPAPPAASAPRAESTPPVPRPRAASPGNRETFERLSRLVDTLEDRIAASAKAPAAPAEEARSLNAAIRRAEELSAVLREESEEHQRQSRAAAAQLEGILKHTRSAFEGIRTLLAETDERRQELSDLSDRVGLQQQALRATLIETRKSAASPAFTTSKSSVLSTATRTRSDVLGPPPGRDSAEAEQRRAAVLLEVSRGVAALQSLADNCRASVAATAARRRG